MVAHFRLHCLLMSHLATESTNTADNAVEKNRVNYIIHNAQGRHYASYKLLCEYPQTRLC
jgi:hypothetical protein